MKLYERQPAGFALLLGVALQLVPITGVAAVSDSELFRGITFDVQPTGTVSRGMGGTGVALGSDTAYSLVNPATLGGVTRFEWTVEYLDVDPDDRTTPAATGGATPSSTFVDPASPAGRLSGSDPSFIGVARPFLLGDRRFVVRGGWARTLSAEYGLSAEDGTAATARLGLPGFPVVVDPGPPPAPARYAVDDSVAGAVDARLERLDLAVAVELRPQLYAGLGIGVSSLDLEGRASSRLTDPLGLVNATNPRLDLGGGNFSDIVRDLTIDESENDFGLTLGLQWTGVGSGGYGDRGSWSFGLAYNEGMSFEVDEGIRELDPNTGMFDEIATEEGSFELPSRITAGVGYERRRFAAALELAQIGYDSGTDGFRAGRSLVTSGAIPEIPAGALTASSYTIEDGTEIHLGAQVRFGAGEWVTTVRAGFYTDPFHGLELRDVESIDPETLDALRSFLPVDEDSDHFTLGVSFGMQTGFSLDAALDAGDEETSLLLSGTFRLGKEP